MKLKIDDDIVIYLNKYYIKNKDIENKEEIKNIIKNISDKYNLDLKGFLEIKIYQDKNYGIIINIKREDLEYFDCFELDIETDIKIIEKSFLYKIDDYAILDNLKDYKMMTYKNNLYIELKDETDISLGKIIENTKIIYGNKIDEILKRGKIVKSEVITWLRKQLP